jgi:hypothetical protein
MNHSIPILCSIALGIIFMVLAPGAQAADTGHSKANLRLASLNTRAATPNPMNLCMNLGSNPECEATFTRALQSANDEAASVVVTATGTGNMKGPHGIQPLRFQKRAPWVRRLDTLSKDGIAFFRVPRGPQNELVVGINRKGVLGFQLRKISN